MENMLRSALNFLDKTQEGATNLFSKVVNKSLMEGTMAGLALVCRANGEIKNSEMNMMVGSLGRDEDLRVYDINKCIDEFKKRLSGFDLNEIIGETECLSIVGKVKDQDKAKLMIAKCIALAGADGDFDDNEKAAVRKICTKCNVDSGEFGL